MITVFSRQNLPCFQITYNVIQGGNCGECVTYIDCSGNNQSVCPPAPLNVWQNGNSGTFCASQTPEAPCPGDREFNMVISNIGVCGTSPTPTPSVTPTRTPSPSPTPTPTPTCAGASSSFLAGTICYGSEWNVILRPSSVSACQAAQGLDGPAANAPNQWRSCCDYQSRFVEGNPSGCLVYDENGNLAGNGWISDGCFSWQVTNGVVTSSSAQICTGSDFECCGSTPT